MICYCSMIETQECKNCSNHEYIAVDKNEVLGYNISDDNENSVLKVVEELSNELNNIHTDDDDYRIGYFCGIRKGLNVIASKLFKQKQ